jgi:acetylornithine/N-succinyldiaminopimelate aminotransferase
MLKFAKLLTKNSCFDKVFFGSSGAEANESAIKLARKYGSKYLNGAFEIITTTNGFHGRTLATMAATGKKHWEALFAPKVSGFVHVPFNNADAVRSAINDRTCAIMLEPIQGEGGVNIASDSYIKDLRKICDEKNILLIFDEIQTGLGRTGTLFDYERYGVEPDIMTLAKGIGGGFPLSSMLTKKEFDIFEPGDQGGSYSSQPLAMSVGFAVVNHIIEANLSENADLMGNYLLQVLEAAKKQLNIKNIRGKGLLVAFDLSTPNANEIAAKCLSCGLAINAPNPSTIRLMPALIVSKKDIDEMMTILCKVLTDEK